jgi:hypothetical protein
MIRKVKKRGAMVAVLTAGFCIMNVQRICNNQPGSDWPLLFLSEIMDRALFLVDIRFEHEFLPKMKLHSGKNSKA